MQTFPFKVVPVSIDALLWHDNGRWSLQAIPSEYYVAAGSYFAVVAAAGLIFGKNWRVANIYEHAAQDIREAEDQRFLDTIDSLAASTL